MVLFEITKEGVVIFIIAIILGLISSLVIKFTMGKEAKETRERQKVLSEELKAALKAKDIKKAKSLQSELVRLSLSSMRFSLKPMLITFIPFILVFWWMAVVYGAMGDVYFEMNISDQNLGIFNCPIKSELYHCNSSYYNGTLKAGQTLDFSIIVVALNQSPKTRVEINGFAEDIHRGERYVLFAETVTVLEGDVEKSPYYKKERTPVEINPKFSSKLRDSAIVRYDFKLINHQTGKVVTLFGVEISWFWWYIIVAIPFSFISGRLLKLY